MTYKEAAQLIEKAKMQQITGFIFMFDMSLRRSLSDGKTTFKIEKPEIDVLDAREIVAKQYPDIEFQINDYHKYHNVPRYFEVIMIGERQRN